MKQIRKADIYFMSIEFIIDPQQTLKYFAFYLSHFAFMILLYFLISPALAQDNDLKSIYESRKIQAEFLVQMSEETDSLLYYYVREAEYFAQQDEYQIATDLLDQAINYLSSTADTLSSGDINFLDLIKPLTAGPAVKSQSPGNWQITTEVGTDYSRNEYELSFLESDSLILEQINNPFLALRISRNHSSGQKWLNFYNYTRVDREIFQTSFYMAMESMGYKKNWRIEGHTNWFWLLEENSGTFWENGIRLFWNYLLTSRNRFYFQANLRSKLYLPSSETYRNIFDSDLYFAFRHSFQILHWLELSVRPRRYTESQTDGTHYSQINTQLEYNNRLDFNQYLMGRINHYYRDFRNSILDDEYSNQYQSIRPSLEAEYPVLFPFGVEARMEGDLRLYQNPDLTYSDYTYKILNVQLKYYFNVYNAVGVGYLYEVETHSSDNPSESAAVELEDFHAQGISLSFEILHIKGLMISLNYGYLLRTFPNAGIDDILGIYSNRRIHSLQLFGFIPLSSRWQFQFFTNYDNDKDRDHENNDNLNTLFNASFLYQF